jgi:hypothetical protein
LGIKALFVNDTHRRKARLALVMDAILIAVLIWLLR